MRTRLSLLFVALALAGCSNIWNPSPMPSGYTYLNDEYKAPPGPPADNLGYAYSPEKNAQIGAIWNDVAKDMIAALETKTGMGPQTVYLHPAAIASAFNASYDEALRAQLTDRGYTLLEAPSANALTLQYSAHLPDEVAKPETHYNGDPEKDKHPKYAAPKDYDDYILTLSAIRNGVAVGQSGGTYKLPVYGYTQEAPVFFKTIMGGKRK